MLRLHTSMAHPAFRGVGVTGSSISAPSNALPRWNNHFYHDTARRPRVPIP